MDPNIFDAHRIKKEPETADVDDTDEQVMETDEYSKDQYEKDSSDGNDNVQTLAKPKRGKAGQRKKSFGTDFPCKYCPSSYKREGSLNAHVRSYHPDKYHYDGIIRCDFAGCEKSFTSQIGLKIHKNIHTRKMVREKKEVEETAETNKDLPVDEPSNETVESVRSNNSQEILLSDDEASYDIGGEEIDDREKEEDREIHQFCDNCSKVFRNLYFLKRHEEKCHMSARDPFCKKCGEVFDSADQLNLHYEFSRCEKETTFSAEVPKWILEKSSTEEFADAEPSVKKVKLEGTVDLNDSAISPFEAENVEKCEFSLWWILNSLGRLIETEMKIIWTEKLDEFHLKAVSQSHHNAVFCVKNLDLIQLADEYRYSLQNTNVSTFLLIESADTFSHWTVISFNTDLILSDFDFKVFKKIEAVERKFSESAEENGLTVINMMAFSGNEYFNNLAKKLTKKVLIFKCSK